MIALGARPRILVVALRRLRGGGAPAPPVRRRTRGRPAMIALGPRPRILVVALRRLGDVLLTTPLIRSLKRAWPDAAIDVLVFAGTEGILAGNPDIANLITMPEHSRAAESLALLRRLWRRYDLALSTQG